MKKRSARRPGRASTYNPVAAAVVDQQLREHITDIRITALMLSDGDEARDLLASYACVLGVGAEVAVTIDRQSAEARRLHGGLRTVISMVVDGGALWQSCYALTLQDLIHEAQQLLLNNRRLALQLMPAAQELATNILQGTVRADAVAGAEIYKESQQ